MIVVGVDDTDSRETGMCTTYVAAVLGERLRQAGYDVERFLLVRCNPAVEHKTRGNAAVALHVAGGEPDLDAVASIAEETVRELAATNDPRTNPGLVVAPDLEAVPASVLEFANDAVRDHHEIDDAVELADELGYRTAQWGNGRGRIGALAAVGAWRATDEWTYERIAYREPDRWGTERSVDANSVVAAADEAYPTVWDTVDRTADEVVCVPHTPGPVLFGVRGDDPATVEAVAAAIEAEPIERAVTFVTNQGTDAHVRSTPGSSATERLRDGRAYRVDGVVESAPETRPGGHVFVDVRRTARIPNENSDENSDENNDENNDETRNGTRNEARDADETAESTDTVVECVAFEPTKRFRDSVRALRSGDVVTVCGEVSDGTLKLEKFALRDPVLTETGTPACPSCDRRMKSAGANQGYRCRDCGTSAPGPEERRLDRSLDVGWYEVPPLARRHVAKPLVRGGFDAPTHPER